MRIGQCGKLVSRRLSQSRFGKSQRYAPKTAQAFKIPITPVIPDVHTFSARNYERALFFMGCKVCIGVQRVGDILLLGFTDGCVHGNLDGVDWAVELGNDEK